MKLYEFTFTDNQNLAESDIVQRLQDFLANEAEMQGWAAGYELRQCKEVRQLPDSSRQLTFEVLGEYIDSNALDFESEVQEKIPPKVALASKPIEPEAIP
jgi:hypothetical protein